MKQIILVFFMIWVMSFSNFVDAQDRGWATSIAWSPDGETIAIGSSTGIWLFDNEFNEVSHIDIPNVVYPPTTLAWSSTGEFLVLGYTTWWAHMAQFPILIIDVQSMEIVTRINEVAFTSNVLWHPNENWVVAGTYRGSAHIWDVKTGEEIFYFEESDEDYPSINSTVAVCWLGENTIAITTFGQIYIIATTMNQILQSIDVGSIRFASCDEDSHRIITNSGDLINLQNLSTQQEKLFTEDRITRDFVMTVKWSPDGQRILVYKTNCLVQVFDSQNGEIIQELAGGILYEALVNSHYTDSATWHPDGSRFAAVGQFGDIRVWDAETYELIQRFDGFELGYLEPYGVLNELSEEERKEIDVNNVDNCN